MGGADDPHMLAVGGHLVGNRLVVEAGMTRMQAPGIAGSKRFDHLIAARTQQPVDRPSNIHVHEA